MKKNILIIIFLIFVILGIIIIFNYFRKKQNINNVISEENQKININNVILEENQKININNTSTSNIIKEENQIESNIKSEGNVISIENQKKQNINDISIENQKINDIKSEGSIEISPITNDTNQVLPNNVNFMSDIKTSIVPEIKIEPLIPINFVIKAGSTPAYTKNTNVRGYCKDFYSTWNHLGIKSGLKICASCKDELGLYKHSCIVQCKVNYKNNNGNLGCE